MNQTSKKNSIVLVILVVIASLVLIFSLARLLGKSGEQDARDYVEGEIQAMYYDRYTPEYLEILNQEPQELRHFYQDNLVSETERLLHFLKSELPTEETTARAQKIMASLYQKVRYEIGTVDRERGGDWTVNLVIYPVEVLDFLTTSYIDGVWEEVVEEADIQWETMTDREYEELSQELDNKYTNLLLDEVEKKLLTASYGRPQEVAIRLVERDKTHVIHSADWYELDQLVIDYYGRYR